MFTSQILVFAVLFCLVTVNARYHAEPQSDTEELARIRDQPALQNVQKSRVHGQRRHRRKRWQSNQGYNYPAPSQPFYEERRDYYGQSDLQGQILRLLDELTDYVKRPPPPPPPPQQPIYVPYPVPYPVPQYQCNCQSPQINNKTGVPSFKNRIKMDDTNRNWGFTDYVDVDNENYDRPILFTPLRPSTAARIPEPSRKTPKVSSNVSPQTCDAAVLSCCSPTDSRQQQLTCFTNLGCGSRYSEKACSQEAVDKVLDVFTKAYSPLAVN